MIRLRKSPIEGVRQLLQMLLLPLSQGTSDVSSALDLHERTVYLRKQILFLSHCVPSSVSLSISSLLQVSNLASLNENLILAHLLSVAISPLSKYSTFPYISLGGFPYYIAAYAFMEKYICLL